MQLASAFFELVPYNTVIIDREHNIVRANKKFTDYFGDWENQKCYQVCKKSDKPCSTCAIEEVFTSGIASVTTQSGRDCDGEMAHYLVHIEPIVSEDGEVTHVIKMSMDLFQSDHYLHGYNNFFENSPNYITIIDENYEIVKANKKFREVFGESEGKHCYEIYKKKEQKCKSCPASETFGDHKEHTATEVGFSTNGDIVNYLVTTSVFSRLDDKVALVLEQATDITELNNLQTQMAQNIDHFTSIIDNSPSAIVSLNDKNKVELFNRAARDLFKWHSQKKPGVVKIKEMLPPLFFDQPDDDGRISTEEKVTIRDSYGSACEARMTAYEHSYRGSAKTRTAIFFFKTP